MHQRREIDAQHPEDRGQEALGLTQRSVEDETERQGGFDGEIGILELPAPPADASRCPRGDRVRREPEGDVASPHEGSVVLGPVPDAIRCLVLRMHSRLHIEIMTRRRSRWSTCRPLLAHRAESAHQRLLDRLPISIERIPGIAHHLARVGDVPELLGQPEQADLVFDHRWVCTHHGVPFWSSSLRLSWSTTRVTPLLFPEEVSDHIATSTTQWFRGSVVAAARRGHSSCCFRMRGQKALPTRRGTCKMVGSPFLLAISSAGEDPVNWHCAGQ